MVCSFFCELPTSSKEAEKEESLCPTNMLRDRLKEGSESSQKTWWVQKRLNSLWMCLQEQKEQWQLSGAYPDPLHTLRGHSATAVLSPRGEKMASLPGELQAQRLAAPPGVLWYHCLWIDDDHRVLTASTCPEAMVQVLGFCVPKWGKLIQHPW